MRNGRIQFQSAIGDLAKQHEGFLCLDVCDAVKAQTLLEGLGFSSEITGANHVRVSSVSRQHAGQVHASLIHAGLQLFESAYQKPSLEQWFLNSTDAENNVHAD